MTKPVATLPSLIDRQPLKLAQIATRVLYNKGLTKEANRITRRINGQMSYDAAKRYTSHYVTWVDPEEGML